MPLQATSGAASYDAFGGGVPVVPNYIEDVFSTYLYRGNDGTQTITNGIDLSTKGGLVWIKERTSTSSHILTDTARGIYNYISSNSTNAQTNSTDTLTAFNNNGFTISYSAELNEPNQNYASWTFRKQPKFFDIVTFTKDTSSNQRIPHNLGSVPGCIIVKTINSANNWYVYHRSFTGGGAAIKNFMVLDGTDAVYGPASSSYWGTAPTSTDFGVSNELLYDGGSAESRAYVAYVFAHDAGGFGLTGTDNVISCGTYTGTGSPLNVTLGYEPQWLLVKKTSATGNWILMDTMRGMSMTTSQWLYPNAATIEDASGTQLNPTATGFTVTSTGSGLNGGGATYIYIAIRRGPMKVPTSGTNVFSPTLVTGNGTNDRQITGVGFPPDLLIGKTMGTALQPLWYDKLRGKGKWVESNNTLAEQTLGGGSEGLMLQDGFVVDNNWGSLNINTRTYVNWMFRRAPSFFDEVCYTGTGSDLTLNHNLGVAPQIIIIKKRVAIGSSTSWYCGWNMNASTYMEALLNTSDAGTLYNYPNWFTSAPTSTTFALAGGGNVNSSGATAVAYLFATCAGVSKVGSYTGNGTTQTINCGFTGGARFVMVKATSTTGNWIVADSARGIVAGNDPALYLNSTAAEVTGLDWIDADNSGFVVNETATIAANTNGVSYIFLAVA
jgi:hypothetical protein